jgi:hypothetical protein
VTTHHYPFPYFFLPIFHPFHPMYHLNFSHRLFIYTSRHGSHHIIHYCPTVFSSSFFLIALFSPVDVLLSLVCILLSICPPHAPHELDFFLCVFLTYPLHAHFTSSFTQTFHALPRCSIQHVYSPSRSPAMNRNAFLDFTPTWTANLMGWCDRFG